MSSSAQLLLMIGGMHILALLLVGALLFPALRNDSDLQLRTDQDSDDGWGHGPPRPPTPPDTPSGGLALDQSDPARARLRDHRRLADFHPRPERRPTHAPERTPVRSH